MNNGAALKCPKCEKDNPVNSAECEHCGIIFSKYRKTEEKNETGNLSLLTTCRVCQKEISKNALSCPHCGEPGGGTDTLKKIQEHSSSRIRYASFGKRIVAFIIDMTLIFIVVAIFAAANKGQHGLQDAVRGMMIFTMFLYYSVMESLPTQGTLGKLLLGIKVADMEGNKIGPGRAMGHGFVRLFSGMLFGAGYLMAFFTEKNQCLHDQAAKCIVVER